MYKMIYLYVLLSVFMASYVPGLFYVIDGWPRGPYTYIDLTFIPPQKFFIFIFFFHLLSLFSLHFILYILLLVIFSGIISISDVELII